MQWKPRNDRGIKCVALEAMQAHHINSGLCADYDEWRIIEADAYPHFDANDARQSQSVIHEIDGEHFKLYLLCTDTHYAVDIMWDQVLDNETWEKYMYRKYSPFHGIFL